MQKEIIISLVVFLKMTETLHCIVLQHSKFLMYALKRNISHVITIVVNKLLNKLMYILSW